MGVGKGKREGHGATARGFACCCESFLLTIANPEKPCAAQQQREFGIFEKNEKNEKNLFIFWHGPELSRLTMSDLAIFYIGYGLPHRVLI
jgi:hypothetical protein